MKTKSNDQNLPEEQVNTSTVNDPTASSSTDEDSGLPLFSSVMPTAQFFFTGKTSRCPTLDQYDRRGIYGHRLGL